MAILYSEDENIKTSIEILILKEEVKSKNPISWVPYKILLKSADKELSYKKEEGCKGAGDYVFALKPVNEIENLIAGIESFLNNQTKSMCSFEPLEPSFELILERSHKGYSASLWIDAGNVVSDHYTWDGFGVRFFTTLDKINLFVSELEREKEGLFA